MPGYLGDYLTGLMILLFILSPLFIAVGTTVIGAVGNRRERRVATPSADVLPELARSAA